MKFSELQTKMQKGFMESNKVPCISILFLLFLLVIMLLFTSCKTGNITIPIGEELETIPVSSEQNQESPSHPYFTMQQAGDTWIITGLTDIGAEEQELTIPALWNGLPVTRIHYLMSGNLRSLRTEEGAEVTFDSRSIVSLPQLTELVLVGKKIVVEEFCFTDCPKLLAIQVGEGSVAEFGNAVANGNIDPLYIMFLDNSRISIGSQSFLKVGSLSLGANTEVTVSGSSFREGGMLFLSRNAKLFTASHSFSVMQSVTMETGASIISDDYCFSSLESADLMPESSWGMGDYCLSNGSIGTSISLGTSASMYGGNACLGSVAFLSMENGSRLEFADQCLHAHGPMASIHTEGDAVVVLGNEAITNFKTISINGTSTVSVGDRSFCGYSAALSLSLGATARINAGNGCFQNAGSLNFGEGCHITAGEYAFAYSDSLSTVILPRGVVLGEYAFAYSKKLSVVSFHDGCNDIAAYSFHGCSSLSKVTIPATVTHIGGNAFGNTASSIIIFGKSGSVSEYYAAENNIEFCAE